MGYGLWAMGYGLYAMGFHLKATEGREPKPQRRNAPTSYPKATEGREPIAHTPSACI